MVAGPLFNPDTWTRIAEIAYCYERKAPSLYVLPIIAAICQLMDPSKLGTTKDASPRLILMMMNVTKPVPLQTL